VGSVLVFALTYSQNKVTRYDAKPTLALFTFENDSLPIEDLAFYTQLLELELNHTKSFIIVEQNQIYELLNEKGYDRIDCTSKDCAYEIGRIIGFKKAITGSLKIQADTCIISAELMNIQSQEGEVKSERTYVGEIKNINPYIQIMAWEFAGLDAPKDILEIVEKPDEVTDEEKKSIWAKWIIKPVNYIANRIREFLFSSSPE